MKYKPVLLLLISLLLFLGCGPDYPDDGTGNVTYPVPEFSDGVLNYNTIRDELHCEVAVHYDSLITDLRVDLSLEGFRITGLQETLNDSGKNGDAIAGDGVFTKNILLERVDSLDGNVYAKYDIYEQGESILSYYDTLSVIANLPPVITEITMPDTIIRPLTGTKALLISLVADDPNGMYDVESAFFQVLSNSTGQWSADYAMYDSGKEEDGDAVAGDGVFSRGLLISSANTATTNYFRFRVKDTAANFSDWSLDSVVVR